MSTKYVDRKHDEDIIDIMNSILSEASFTVETVNEAVLCKLMELRGTPIKYDRTLRDIDGDFDHWQKATR